MTDWQVLIERYKPADKRICNCRDAYATRIPGGALQTNPGGEPVRIDSWQCEYGCSSAQISARDHVAKCIRDAERR